MQNLTPRQIVEELDKYIVGQDDAKRAVAIAIRNRWRRQQLPDELREEVGPKNIIMIGPTGVGKTEIARRLAALVNAPFIKVEATKYTEVGYHGRDVESMVRELLDRSIHIVREEQTEVVRERAESAGEERLLDALLPLTSDVKGRPAGPPPHGEPDAAEKHHRTREKFRAQLRAGELEDRNIDVSVEERSVPAGMFATIGVDQMDPELQNFFERLIPGKPKRRRLPVREARRIFFAEECDRLIDREKVTEMAVRRCENSGMIFVDEMDKIAGSDKTYGPDVSRQGVQRDLLPVVEGTTVMTRYGPVRTDHVLFIAAGAFHSSKPADLMPELQGRFPIRVELTDLTKEDFVRILTEPRNAVTKQQIAMMATEGVKVRFTADAIERLAEIAFDVNRSAQNIGARRLYTVTEKLMEEVSFTAPERGGSELTIDAGYVSHKLADISKDEDLSKFIL
jgi:ATP-dependent HslUV protease ATP-binding subunit HslU